MYLVLFHIFPPIFLIDYYIIGNQIINCSAELADLLESNQWD